MSDQERQGPGQGTDSSESVALIGLAGRFPQAPSVDALWGKLRAGESCISYFSDQELLEAGTDPHILADPNYVKAGGILEGIDLFDAEFFSMTPKEAEITDPQQRFFLECAWEALENAGYDPGRCRGRIGVFASASLSSYLPALYSDPQAVRLLGHFRTLLGNDKDFLATWVSYKLDLRGPSVSVQTACSSSLVGVHLACQSLLNYECDLALAGGVSVRRLRKSGYLYQEGGVSSPDGYCRAFDARAQGAVSGDGVGIVVLKRLEDAEQDGDWIQAVIRGSAVNNDGARKVGYTAPSVEGQAKVIREALAVSGVDAQQIQYVEAHGTGTPLGDPIEVEALRQAFGGARPGQCALASVKASIGHLDAAAGIAGLIKAVEALKRRELPASLHFERPNPKIDFGDSPFYVNARLSAWKSEGALRRAGVSSFGIGGTNAHVVLEEAPPQLPSPARREWHWLPLSARSESALQALTSNLASHLRRNPSLSLADLAYTCLAGRRRFSHRRTIVCRDLPDAVQALQSLDPDRVSTSLQENAGRPVAFLLSGQGSQYPGMGWGLYQAEPSFRSALDACSELLKPELGLDLRTLLSSGLQRGEPAEEGPDSLHQTRIAQPALFALEYALAQLWQSWGIQPEAMIGHSVGEYVAACLADVFSLEEGLRLMAARGRLMQQAAPGAMLSISLSESEATERLGQRLCLAAVNGPSRCVVSGPVEAVEELERRLSGEGVEWRRLRTSHAFHCWMMDSVQQPFAALLRKVKLSPPRIPFISNLTGSWIREEEATDPDYWVRHLRQPVRFAEGIDLLTAEPRRALLEVGPGTSLCMLVRRHPGCKRRQPVLASLRHPQDPSDDAVFWLQAMARLWREGCLLEWPLGEGACPARRVPLPGYPFERQSYWAIGKPGGPVRRAAPSALVKKSQASEWLYLPSWKRATPTVRFRPGDLAGRQWLWMVFEDETGLGRNLAQRLRSEGQQVIRVTPGEGYRPLHEGACTLRPANPADYESIFADLEEKGRRPDAVVHLWGLTAPALSEPAGLDRALQTGYYSLSSLARALSSRQWCQPLRLTVATNGLQQVTGEESLQPEKATVLGPCRVIPQEFPHITCQNIDFALPGEGGSRPDRQLMQLLAELALLPPEPTVAYRGAHRWVEWFEAAPCRERPVDGVRLRPGGVYLITGGLGRVGMVLADFLARRCQGRIVLTCRSPFPARQEWGRWLQARVEDDGVSRKIRALMALEQNGAQVEAASVDAADREGMHRLLEGVEERLGPLNGVIHAAGVVGEGAQRFLSKADRSQSELQFRSKVRGTLVLEELLRGRPVDFCMLTSSLASVLGGLGFSAYAAANRFMDALAQKASQESPFPWISVNWDGWDFTGGAGHRAALALTPEEGAQALDLLFGMDDPVQVAVSGGDLQARLRDWVKRRPDASEAQPEPPADARPQGGGAAVPEDADSLEQALIEIWKELLGIESIRPQDNFFELGGDSLLATRLVSRLGEKLHLAVPMQMVFEAPTASGMARKIAQSQAAAEREEVPPVVRVERGQGLPLSFSQQRLWFLDQMESHARPYNMLNAIRLQGRLDLGALAASLSEIARRHEILRTVFGAVQGRPVQLLLPWRPLPLPRIDLQGLPEQRREPLARQLALEEARRPYDLSRGPLFKNFLLHLGERGDLLVFAAHHILCDGWSVGIFQQELAPLYNAFSQGKPSPLAELPVQYADYAVWQRSWLSGKVLERQISYWRERLEGVPRLELATDFPRPPHTTFRGATERMIADSSLRQQLLDLNQRQGVTFFMTLLAAWKILLHRISGQSEIVVGTNVANRRHSEAEGLIGLFVNNLVLRTDLSGDPSALDVIGRVRDVALGAFEHQDLPFERLVEELQPERELGRHPLFQVLFVHQNVAPKESLKLAGLQLAPFPLRKTAAAFELTLNTRESPQGISFELTYCSDLFKRSTIEQWLDRLKMLLQDLLSHPAQPISMLSLGAEEQEAQLAAAFAEDWDEWGG